MLVGRVLVGCWCCCLWMGADFALVGWVLVVGDVGGGVGAGVAEGAVDTGDADDRVGAASADVRWVWVVLVVE